MKNNKILAPTPTTYTIKKVLSFLCDKTTLIVHFRFLLIVISGMTNICTYVYIIPGKKIRFQVMTNINMYISCLEKNFNEAGTKKWHLRFGLKFTFDFWLVLAIWRRLLPLFGPLTQATSCLDTDLFKGMTYIHMLLLLLSRQKKEGSCKIYAYISRDFFLAQILSFINTQAKKMIQMWE